MHQWLGRVVEIMVVLSRKALSSASVLFSRSDVGKTILAEIIPVIAAYISIHGKGHFLGGSVRYKCLCRHGLERHILQKTQAAFGSNFHIGSPHPWSKLGVGGVHYSPSVFIIFIY